MSWGVRSSVGWLAAWLIWGVAALPGQETTTEFVPRPGIFPPPNSGHYFAGELVAIDPINRRGALRLDGDFVSNKYHAAPSHQFALLPYGTVYYHGAPAELRDVPLGTHLHGYFYLPPQGDTTIPPPVGTAQVVSYVPKYNHAVSLEDDVSFCTRRHRTWKISAIDQEAKKLHVVSSVTQAADGLTGEQKLDFDGSTRVWRGREFAELADLAVGQEVQFNLTWSPEWENHVFHLSDVWIGDESLKVAAERQRQVHIRYQRYHWLAASVDQVEQQPGGSGLVTLTLFGGMDHSLYDEIDNQRSVALAVAEKTLRTWWHNHDSKSGKVVAFQRSENPPPGSSGIQIQVQMNELLEGYRAGHIVRVRAGTWPNFKLPPEERIKSMEER